MFDPILIAAHNPGPMTGRGNNTYLVAGPSGAFLIDAGVGHPRHLREVDAALQAREARLERLLVTHAHLDHASGAPRLLGVYPALQACKYPWPEADAAVDVTWQPLADGDVFDVGHGPIVTIHTPGHSPDHLIFWHEDSRTAFTGDLVVAGSSVMIDWSAGGNLGQYMTSLERLLELAPKRLLPAHGVEVADPAALVRGYLDHRRARERQVVAALDAGCDSVQAIADSIYHGLDPALLPAARENVRAHLEKLQSEGRAREDNGTWTTSSTSST